MIPSIQCSLPLSVDILGPTTPHFQTKTHNTPSFQTQLTPLGRPAALYSIFIMISPLGLFIKIFH